MIPSKSKHGFTLIEVVLAVAIMAAILTPLFISQGTTLLSIGTFSDRYRRIIAAKSYLLGACKDQSEHKKTEARHLEEPPTTLTYTREKLSGPLGKQFKDMYRQQVKIQWTEGTRTYSDVLVGLVFDPQEPAGGKA